jgi:hypothetical protein
MKRKTSYGIEYPVCNLCDKMIGPEQYFFSDRSRDFYICSPCWMKLSKEECEIYFKKKNIGNL